LTTIRQPTFTAARRQTLWWVSASVGLMVAGQFAVVGALREPVTVCGVVLAAYAAARHATLTAVERHQYAFEPVWLAQRSAGLRAAQLEVVRCVVGGRGYDLTDSAAVADLVSEDPDTRVTLDLAYRSHALERAHRKLGDLEFRPLLRPGVPARARFPQAHYALRPCGTTTYWSLGEPVVLTVARPADPAARRAGTGSTGRPGATRRAGARPPGRT
jgi:hypothetical protein